MQPVDLPKQTTVGRGLAWTGATLMAMGALGAFQVLAQPAAPTHNAALPSSAEQGVRWQDLGAGQKTALRPLERDWRTLTTPQKLKWLEVAARFPSLNADEKSRVQTRMTEWTKLTNEQRGEARVNYQQAKQVAPQDRRSRWEAYQSLTPEEKRNLAARAAPPASDTARRPAGQDRNDGAGTGAEPRKSNIVPNPAFSAPAKPVAPTVLQAQPGATTTLISKRPSPPAHQQTGMPKISAGPTFVDKATLLPQRGPQGAAARSAVPAADPSATR